MKKFLKKKLGNEKGMTLIELLAVIVILAIIAAIAIPAISNIIENSRVGAAKSDALNIFASADLYHIENADVTPITQDLLEDGGFVEDLGGFEGAATDFEFTTATAAVAAVPASGTTPAVPAVQIGDLLLSGTAEIGNVTVTFADTPRGAIQALSNSAETGGDVLPPGTITVDRD